MCLPYITAHSGCEDTGRDSMESIDRAIALGADVVEVDVRRAPDGSLRVSHNSLTLQEYGEKPLLEDVFSRLRGTPLALNCDIKEAAALYDTLDLAQKHGFGRGRLICSGCTSPEQIARDPSLLRRAGFYANLEEIWKFLYFADRHRDFDGEFQTLMVRPWPLLTAGEIPERWLDAAVQFARTFDVQGLNLPYYVLDHPFFETFRAAGVPLSVWTVNDPETMELCIRAGVENITTLEVRLALEVRGRLCGCQPRRQC